MSRVMACASQSGCLSSGAANLFIMREFDWFLRKNLLFPQVKQCENAIKQTFVFLERRGFAWYSRCSETPFHVFATHLSIFL